MSRHHFGARLHDYTSLGHRRLALENELLRVEVLVDMGSDIVSFLHKPTDTDFLWHRTPGLRPAGPGTEPRGTDEFVFVDRYEGGWQECFPNGGESVRYKGAQLPFHGELLTLPWAVTVLEDRPEVVSVRLSVHTLRTPFLLEKVLTLRAGRSVLEIDERLSNLADEAMQVMWGHHPAFGPPFLDETCRIDLPPCTGTTERAEPWAGSDLAWARPFAWPHAPLEIGGTRDLSHVPPASVRSGHWIRFTDFTEGWYGVTSGRLGTGIGLRWDARLFPHLWMWQVWGGMPGYPWYGQNYNVALEPWTSWPDGGLLRAIENGSARTIGPRETVETRLLAVAWTGRERIGGIDAEGEVVS
jgi:hypothetical protein